MTEVVAVVMMVAVVMAVVVVVDLATGAHKARRCNIRRRIAVETRDVIRANRDRVLEEAVNSNVTGQQERVP
jgi:hypothetical protein